MTLPLGEEVAARLGLSSSLAFFPVRHHSPTCAHKLSALLSAMRPDVVLIEGPSKFNDRIDVLADPAHRTPFALLAVAGEAGARWYARQDEEKLDRTPPALPLRAYYPFCDFSPELCAIREARRLGIEVRFIDRLHGPEDAPIAEVPARDDLTAALGERLGGPDDGPLSRSRYTQALYAQTGCRDFDELWEVLFEQGGWDLTPEGWALAVGTYALLSRRTYRVEELEGDGTLARERFMAEQIAEASAHGRRVLVVAGAFHAVALGGAREEILARARSGARAPVDRSQAEVLLVPYTFPRLDALMGYAPGMSGPAFYQHLWEAQGEADPFERAALVVLLATIRAARAEGDPLGPADAIAALAFARELSALRGRPRVGRVEVIEAATSCFVKGEDGVAGRRVLSALTEAMRGSRVGVLGPSAGPSPLVADFHDATRALRLPVAHGRPHPLRLDVARPGGLHRARSWFFHRCVYLGIGFCRRVAGPDVETGEGDDRTVERWTVQYVPEIDGRLLELSPLGASVEEAAMARLAGAASASARRAGAIAGHVARAVLMGLPALLARLGPMLAGALGSDEDPASLLEAGARLVRMSAWRARVGTAEAARIEALAQRAYLEATLRFDRLAALPPARRAEVPALLAALQGAALHGSQAAPPRDLLVARARDARASAARAPLILGALDGLLLSLGEADPGELGQKLLAPRAAPDAPGAYLEGVLGLAPRALLDDASLLGALVDHAVGAPLDAFLAALPSLRRALGRLGPREAEAAARLAAARVGLSSVEPIEVLAAPPDEVARLAAWEQRWLSAETAWAGPREPG